MNLTSSDYTVAQAIENDEKKQFIQILDDDLKEVIEKDRKRWKWQQIVICCAGSLIVSAIILGILISCHPPEDRFDDWLTLWVCGIGSLFIPNLFISLVVYNISNRKTAYAIYNKWYRNELFELKTAYCLKKDDVWLKQQFAQIQGILRQRVITK